MTISEMILIGATVTDVGWFPDIIKGLTCLWVSVL